MLVKPRLNSEYNCEGTNARCFIDFPDRDSFGGDARFFNWRDEFASWKLKVSFENPRVITASPTSALYASAFQASNQADLRVLKFRILP